MDTAAKVLPPGALVTLTDAGGQGLATAYFNAKTLIAARVLSPVPDEAVDAAFVARRIASALALRERIFAAPFYRLIHAEADGLPGLAVDRFGETCVIQPNTAGMTALLDAVVKALDETIAPKCIVLRGDSGARKLEGLEDDVRVLRGSSSETTEVKESALTFFADLMSGQKTGWYFDQRDNHAFMGILSSGALVLDLYTHTGGFALTCAQAGAKTVEAVDSSEPALALANKAADANGLASKCTFTRSDVFAFLEKAIADGKTWDVVIADPPPFIKSKKDLKAGLQGYRKLARLCAQVTAPGGFMFQASCSHNAPPPEFQSAVVRGVSDARRTGRVIRTSRAGPDHPVHPQLPESAYLKAVVLQLD